MDTIKSLEELIDRFDHSDPSSHGKVLKKMNIPISDFEAFESWDKKSYTRNCIFRTNECELILICWKKGDKTLIHEHDGQKCWVYPLKGDITETRIIKFYEH